MPDTMAEKISPFQDRIDLAKSLFGILPASITLEEACEERLTLLIECNKLE